MTASRTAAIAKICSIPVSRRPGWPAVPTAASARCASPISPPVSPKNKGQQASVPSTAGEDYPPDPRKLDEQDNDPEEDGDAGGGRGDVLDDLDLFIVAHLDEVAQGLDGA